MNNNDIDRDSNAREELLQILLRGEIEWTYSVGNLDYNQASLDKAKDKLIEIWIRYRYENKVRIIQIVPGLNLHISINTDPSHRYINVWIPLEATSNKRNLLLKAYRKKIFTSIEIQDLLLNNLLSEIEIKQDALRSLLSEYRFVLDMLTINRLEQDENSYSK